MNFKEKNQRRNEIIEKYTTLLQAFGYEDIHIDPVYPFNTETKLFSLRRIDTYFGDNNCGYQLSISYRALEEYSSENIIFIYELLMTFVSKSEYLKEFDITKKLTEYLQGNDFNIMHTTSFLSDQNSSNMRVCKNGVEYLLYLKRWNAEIKRVNLYEEDEDDPIEFPKDETEELKEEFKKILLETSEINEHKIEISADWQKIKIILYWHFVKHSFEIHSYTNNLSDEDVKDSFCNIVWYFLESLKCNNNSFVKDLKDEYFHIIDDSNDDTHLLFAYKCGEQYQIKYTSEKKPGDEAFQKTINTSKLTIDFDHMDGHSFERFCAKLLEANGFENVYVTQGSGDQGIDIIAYKDCIKYGIQCKCYSSDIGNKAVQEAFAGQAFYGCHIGVVLTNQHFTKSAIELAQKNRIILWDRTKLKQMIEVYEAQQSE